MVSIKSSFFGFLAIYLKTGVVISDFDVVYKYILTLYKHLKGETQRG